MLKMETWKERMQMFFLIVSLCSTYKHPCPPTPSDGTKLSWSMTINYSPGMSWFNIYQCLVRVSKKVTVLLHLFAFFLLQAPRLSFKALSSVSFISVHLFSSSSSKTPCTCENCQHNTSLVDFFSGSPEISFTSWWQMNSAISTSASKISLNLRLFFFKNSVFVVFLYFMFLLHRD